MTTIIPKMPNWIPAPGTMATYIGRTKAQTRNVIVIAEAVRGCMVVEAIGKKGINVRLTVSRDSLRQPQPDLFA
jgi:hypothetical protein